MLCLHGWECRQAFRELDLDPARSLRRQSHLHGLLQGLRVGGEHGFGRQRGRWPWWRGLLDRDRSQRAGVRGGAGHSRNCTSTSVGGRKSQLGIEKDGPHITAKTCTTSEQTRPIARLSKVCSRITGNGLQPRGAWVPWQWRCASHPPLWRYP